MASKEQRFEADKKYAYRALQDARQYVTDMDRTGSKAEALYERLSRASRMMRPWSTDGTSTQSKKAIEYLDEVTSILSEKIGPASRREFSEQGGARHHATKKKSPTQLDREIIQALTSRSGLSKYQLDLLSRRKPGGGLRAGYLTPTGWHGDPMVIEDRKLRLEALREQPAPRFPKEPGRSHATKRATYSVVEVFNLPAGRTQVKVERSGIRTMEEAKKIRERIAFKRAQHYGARGAHYLVRKERA